MTSLGDGRMAIPVARGWQVARVEQNLAAMPLRYEAQPTVLARPADILEAERALDPSLHRILLP